MMPRIPDQTKRERLDRVEALLRRSDGLTEREVADILNFERRTTHNYLQELDLEGKAYKEGQLWFALPYRSPVLRQFELHPEEAMVLYLAARLFVKQSDQRNEAAENVLVKLADILSNDMGLSEDIHHAALQLAQRPVVEGYEDAFRTIMRAYIHRRKVEIVYHPYRGGPFTTKFAPYLLEPSAIGFATYAIGHSSVVDALRTYKLERIKHAKLLINEEYIIPRDFPGHELLANAWSIYHGDETTRVVLRFHPSVARRVQETNWHPSQVLAWDEPDQRFLLATFELANTTDLKPWIRTWGANCEVLEPDQLRDEMTGEARQIAETYGWHTSRLTEPPDDDPLGLDHTFNTFFG